MGFKTWHNYGYGICVSDIVDVPVERLVLLLEHAPVFHQEVNDWLAEQGIENPAFEDYMAYDKDYMLGLSTFLTRVIEEAEHVCFTACDDFNGNDYLIYMPSYPWELPENERSLTEERIEEVLRKYVSIITDDELTIDYQSAENGG